jgi:predicted RND superfamily exporter protein
MLNFVFVWAVGMPLDVLTVMFISIAVGIGVDDSIHLLIEYRHGRASFPADRRRAIAAALERAGKPIVLTSVAIIVGLSALVFSSFLPVVRFGIVISVVLFATTLGALIILPALLSFGTKKETVDER